MELEMKYNSFLKDLDDKNFKLIEVIKVNLRLKIYCEYL